jgi:Ca2+-binding RTX toxin-like protein
VLTKELNGSVIKGAALFAAASAVILAAAIPVGAQRSVVTHERLSAIEPAGIAYRTTTTSPLPFEYVDFWDSGSGETDIGNHCDDCQTGVTFPFPVAFYGQDYTSALAGSNGNLQLTGNSTSPTDSCLPNANFGAALMLFQRDMRTNGTDDVIVKKAKGASPNQAFGLLYRMHYFVSADIAFLGVLFHENDPRIEVGYSFTADTGLSAVTGVQASASGPTTQFSCHGAIPNQTLVTYIPTAGLAIFSKGAGQGVISSTPAGIDCGTTCSAVYDLDTEATLTAAPAMGSQFAGWLGGGCSGTGACMVTITGPTTVTAKFTRKCPGYENDPRHHIRGRAGADLLIGTRGNDIICGLGGNDELLGKRGNDVLLGGRGNDRLFGDRGRDLAIGGPGDDRCSAELKQSC